MHPDAFKFKFNEKNLKNDLTNGAFRDKIILVDTGSWLSW